MQWPWKSSFLLLFLGLLVVFFSLQSMQSKAVAQELAVDPGQPYKDCDGPDWFDQQLPGTPAYQLRRGVDHLTLLSQRGEDLHAEQLDRAKQRFTASQYAWEQGQTLEAVRTLHKAFLYLAEVASHAPEHQAELESLADGIAERIHDWRQTPLPVAEQNLLHETAANLEAVRQHYHF